MNSFRIILLLAVVALFLGCASRRPNLIARTSGAPVRIDLGKISLMPTPHLLPRERALYHDLAAELQRRGITPVPRTESVFSLAVGLEVHSETETQTTTSTAYPPIQPGIIASGPHNSMIYRERTWSNPVTTERVIQTEGIRIRLYPTRELGRGQFQAAWEGYLEAGQTATTASTGIAKDPPGPSRSGLCRSRENSLNENIALARS